LWKFFNERGGPLNYFLLKFPDLIYDLFIFFRKCYKHKKVKQFYPVCFQKVLPKALQNRYIPPKHAPVNKDLKNKSIAHDFQREELERNFNNKKN